MRSRGGEWESSEGDDRSRTIASFPALPSSPKGAGLPGHVPTEAPPVTAESPVPPAESGPRSTALVVDDDPGCRSVVAYMLALAGWATAEASSVASAISHLAHGRCDLIVTDLRLPDAPGAQLIEAVRDDPRHRTVPVIVCTATDHLRELSQAWDAGCTAVVAKPFSFDDLLGTIERTVGRSPFRPLP